eukprot:10427619-Karenia_brevis.AAC.1
MSFQLAVLGQTIPRLKGSSQFLLMRWLTYWRLFSPARLTTASDMDLRLDMIGCSSFRLRSLRDSSGWSRVLMTVPAP